MRKFKKNCRGDSLVEIITSFAIIAIVGVITVTGVVASGRIKVNTSNLQRASLSADEKTQISNGTNGGTATIYREADYDTATGTGTNPLSSGFTLLKGTGTDSSITYNYYDTAVTKDVDETTSSGSGSFGLGGQWTMRFYLEEDVTKQLNAYTEFYIMLTYIDGFPGESASMEYEKMNIDLLGYTYKLTSINYPDYKTSDGSWVYGNTSTEFTKKTDGVYEYKKNETTGEYQLEKVANGSKLSFEKNKNLNICYRCTNLEVTSGDSDGGYEIRNSLQAIDCTYNWSAASSYSIDFNILVKQSDGTYKKLQSANSSDGGIYRRFKVYSRDFGDQSTNSTMTKYGENFFRYGTSNQFPDAKSAYNEENDIEKVKNKRGSVYVENNNYIYNFDDTSEYIYIWDKYDTANPDGLWSSDYAKINEMKVLSLENDVLAWVNFIASGASLGSGVLSKEALFREYLRTQDYNWYCIYKEWLTNQKYTEDHGSASKDEKSACYCFYLYYITTEYPNKYNYSLYVHDYDDGATATLLNFNDLQKYYNTIAQRAISGKSKDDESVVRVFNKLMNYFKEKGITEKTITTIDIETP
jgi:type II secretory pathway pseudopilin PulG